MFIINIINPAVVLLEIFWNDLKQHSFIHYFLDGNDNHQLSSELTLSWWVFALGHVDRYSISSPLTIMTREDNVSQPGFLCKHHTLRNIFYRCVASLSSYWRIPNIFTVKFSCKIFLGKKDPKFFPKYIRGATTKCEVNTKSKSLRFWYFCQVNKFALKAIDVEYSHVGFEIHGTDQL